MQQVITKTKNYERGVIVNSDIIKEKCPVNPKHQLSTNIMGELVCSVCFLTLKDLKKMMEVDK